MSLVQRDTFVTLRDLMGDLLALAVAGLRCMEIGPVAALEGVGPGQELTVEEAGVNLQVFQSQQHCCYHHLHHSAPATGRERETCLLKGRTKVVCSDSVGEEPEVVAVQPGLLEAGFVLKQT